MASYTVLIGSTVVDTDLHRIALAAHDGATPVLGDGRCFTTDRLLVLRPARHE